MPSVYLQQNVDTSDSRAAYGKGSCVHATQNARTLHTEHMQTQSENALHLLNYRRKKIFFVKCYLLVTQCDTVDRFWIAEYYVEYMRCGDRMYYYAVTGNLFKTKHSEYITTCVRKNSRLSELFMFAWFYNRPFGWNEWWLWLLGFQTRKTNMNRWIAIVSLKHNKRNLWK